jgi:hypothetical protein
VGGGGGGHAREKKGDDRKLTGDDGVEVCVDPDGEEEQKGRESGKSWADLTGRAGEWRVEVENMIYTFSFFPWGMVVIRRASVEIGEGSQPNPIRRALSW